MNQHQTDGAATATSPKPVPVIYVRSARDGEGQLEERLEDARELARLSVLDVAQDDEIAEHGSGADIVGRSGLQHILHMAERGEISHLICRDWSRLSRNGDVHRIAAMLAEAGVTVVTGHGTNEPVGANNGTVATLEERR